MNFLQILMTTRHKTPAIFHSHKPAIFPAINIWKEESSSVDIMVDGLRATSVAGLLHEREIAFSVTITDVSNRINREKGNELAMQTENQAAGGTANSTDSTMQEEPAAQKMDWQNYHRLDVIYDFMHGLAEEYPDLCTVCDIGMTSEGRPIKLLKISNGEPTNTGVWLDGCIHAREWISPAVVTYIANEIARGFDEHPCYLATKDWYFLPVVNPDGYEYSHTTDRMWRKNRARFGECIGVDLNRNFSKGWGVKDEEGSSTDPGNIFFRGPAPFSESETAAIRDTILSAEKPFCIYLSFHSYGEVIIFPWGYTADPCPDYVELLQGGSIMAKAILGAHGYTYKVGSTKDLMYFASGTSVDWCYAVAGIPYSYMIELRNKQYRFLLPRNEILMTCSEIWHGIDKLLEYVDDRIENGELHCCSCKVPPDPDCPPEPMKPSDGRVSIGEAIHDIIGRTYKVGSIKDLMYYSSGTSVDWGYSVGKIPFSYLVELQGKKYMFLLPREKIKITCESVYQGIRKLLEYTDDRVMHTGKDCKCDGGRAACDKFDFKIVSQDPSRTSLR